MENANIPSFRVSQENLSVSIILMQLSITANFVSAEVTLFSRTRLCFTSLLPGPQHKEGFILRCKVLKGAWWVECVLNHTVINAPKIQKYSGFYAEALHWAHGFFACSIWKLTGKEVNSSTALVNPDLKASRVRGSFSVLGHILAPFEVFQHTTSASSLSGAALPNACVMLFTERSLQGK